MKEISKFGGNSGASLNDVIWLCRLWMHVIQVCLDLRIWKNMSRKWIREKRICCWLTRLTCCLFVSGTFLFLCKLIFSTAWADYFDQQGIPFRFFSASLSKARLDAEKEAAKKAEALAQGDSDYEPEAEKQKDLQLETTYLDEEANVPERVQIMDAHQLLELFHSECPKTLRQDDPTAKVNIGFVGYPNVGKSSTLNALVGAHKVAVGSTPGKTKHFQTIHLGDSILCDCPGLVFPSFATTKADMVCNGILPIDQLREILGPSGLVAQRIPKSILEAVYGIEIKLGEDAEETDRAPTAEEMLVAFARKLDCF